MTHQPLNSIAPTLPPEWIEHPLGELAHLIRGVTYPKTEASDHPQPGYLPLLRATHIKADGLLLEGNLVYVPLKYIKPEQRLRPDDVIICMSSGSPELVGKAARLREAWPGACGAFCAVTRFKPGIDPRFAAYFFRSSRYRRLIQARSVGININNLRYEDLARLPIPVPPLPEQHHLVSLIEHHFSRLDAGIAALRRVLLKLQHYQVVIGQAAAAGRLVSQNPADEPADLLLQRLLGDEVQASPSIPHPPLPAGWCWATLSTLSDALAGYTFKSKDYTPAGFQIIKIGNVERGKLNLAGKPTFINEVEAKIKDKYLLKPNDLLITLTGTRRKRDYGLVALVRTETGLLLNQRVARLRFKPPLNPHFFLLALQGEHFQDRFFQYETGNVGQGNVKMAAITQEAVPVPPLAEQARIVAEVERRLAAAERLETVVKTNLTRAEELKQAILERAFSTITLE